MGLSELCAKGLPPVRWLSSHSRTKPLTRVVPALCAGGPRGCQHVEVD